MQFDDNLLVQLGINKEGAEKEALLQHLQDTLEERVGLAIYELLTDDEAAAFMKLTDKGDQKAVTDWLTQHVPDYQDLVQDEYDILLGELAATAALV